MSKVRRRLGCYTAEQQRRVNHRLAEYHRRKDRSNMVMAIVIWCAAAIMGGLLAWVLI